jgi:hypothetical protein
MNARSRGTALRIWTVTGLSGVVVFAAPAAYASCAGSPEPSMHAFVGRVVATASHDRMATVHTEDSETVQVVGTPLPAGNSISSVDRTYVVGVTYEFHPVTGTEPFQDHACTATRPVDAVAASALNDGRTGANVLVQPETGDNVAVQGICGAAAAVAGGAGLWLRRRWRSGSGS